MTRDERRRAGPCPRPNHGTARAWGLCIHCAQQHARHRGLAHALAELLDEHEQELVIGDRR